MLVKPSLNSYLLLAGTIWVGSYVGRYPPDMIHTLQRENTRHVPRKNRIPRSYNQTPVYDW